MQSLSRLRPALNVSLRQRSLSLICRLLLLPALILPLGGMDACSGGDSDGDGWTSLEGDCDDSDPEVYPGAIEVCDGEDQDCDEQVDEGLSHDWYVDGDGDGYGLDAETIADCAAPDGYVSNAGDCDDANPDIHPNAAELCDGVDQDCDGMIDEDADHTWYADRDGDGYGSLTDTVTYCAAPDGYVANANDCDDSDASTWPGAPDNAGDGYDRDCGGADGQQPSAGLETSAFTSIQDALDAAVEGETVWVGPGTFLEHDLTLRGRAITLASTLGAAP